MIPVLAKIENNQRKNKLTVVLFLFLSSPTLSFYASISKSRDIEKCHRL